MKKTLALILVVLSVVSILGITAVAVEPRWNNANAAAVALYIDNNGKASITYNCAGISGVTTSIIAETKLERKWLLFWLDVDSAYWIDAATANHLTKTHEIQLSKTGTYRATVDFTVSGTGGASDSIKCTSEYTY